jgi:adenylosuccinate lyase
MAAGKIIKEQGGKNDLLERIADDEAFGMTIDELENLLQPADFIGRAPKQTEEFIENDVRPVLEKYAGLLGLKVDIKV